MMMFVEAAFGVIEVDIVGNTVAEDDAVDLNVVTDDVVESIVVESGSIVEVA